MKRCVYCHKEKEDSEFSEEHTLPKALGGAIPTNNPLVINEVCAWCNNVLGFFVDAPFIKSWLVYNYRIQHLLQEVEIKPYTIIPPIYMGIMEGINFENYICDSYIGPTGDTIYHFHQSYPEEPDYPIIVGLPPHLKKLKLDPGFVIMYVRSNNPEWINTIILSVVDAFPDAIFYAANCVDLQVNGADFRAIPPELEEIEKKLFEMRGTGHKVKAGMDMYLGHRFTAKVALGLASKYLNESFKFSAEARLLKSFMWTKNNEERLKIKLGGTPMLNADERFTIPDSILNWPGSHVFGLIECEGTLSFYASFYGQLSTIIRISENKQHWKDKFSEGLIFVTFPSINKCIGPISLFDYLMHQYGEEKNQDLTDIQEYLKNIPPHPPITIENSPLNQ